MAKLKRKENSLPFKRATDERFKVNYNFDYYKLNNYNYNNFVLLQWLTDDFLGYLAEWEKEIAETQGLKTKEKQRLGLSRETVQGLRITGA